MEVASLILVLCVVLLTWYLVQGTYLRHRKSSANLPPGPYRLPIIGNILNLDKALHICLAKLSKKYGPLMYLKLGSIDVIVASSPEMAKEILQKQDQVFSGRNAPIASQAHDYNKFSVGFLPAGQQWRKLRKICNEHIFSMSRLDATTELRRDKLQKLREYVVECRNQGSVIDIGEVAYKTSLNLISATLFSIDFASYDSGSSQDLKEMVRGMLTVLGTPNIADFFPVLKAFDPQGIKRKSDIYYGKVLGMFEDIVSERLMESRRGGVVTAKTDFLEALIDLSKGTHPEISSSKIKYLLLDLFAAGTDTTASTVEWAMAELLRNPDKMSKAKDELRSVIGENNQVEESDISRLLYLQAVIKETLRYHPAGPLLVPHKAEIDTQINNYAIPKNSQVFVNVWAMGRDSSVWSNPDSFEPERFLDKKLDYKGGQYFEFIPFGSGRRQCPGLPLAHRMLHLMLASLIHNFDWDIDGGIKPHELDMTESFGLSLEKAIPLKVVPIKLL